MKKPDTPITEKARLQDLRSLDILDTPPEERFDRLTRLANRLFNIPIALVSIVDEDRQWFKSSVGLNARQTPRDISFCGHAILGDEIFIVNDTATDSRFLDNPLVLDNPNIRFYAGCPLTSLNGHKLGTMCLIDRKPRGFLKEDQAILKDLAAMVEREIELTHLATNDELTGIPNRRGFKVIAEKSLKLCKRKHLPASIVYFDVDKFKRINDDHGHAEGDRTLSIIANKNLIDYCKQYEIGCARLRRYRPIGRRRIRHYVFRHLERKRRACRKKIRRERGGVLQTRSPELSNQSVSRNRRVQSKSSLLYR